MQGAGQWAAGGGNGAVQRFLSSVTKQRQVGLLSLLLRVWWAAPSGRRRQNKGWGDGWSETTLAGRGHDYLHLGVGVGTARL